MQKESFFRTHESNKNHYIIHVCTRVLYCAEMGQRTHNQTYCASVRLNTKSVNSPLYIFSQKTNFETTHLEF